MDNKLHLAPVNDPQNVLDVGTGTGIWAIDFGMRHRPIISELFTDGRPAEEHPSAVVIGTDLSPVQPSLYDCQQLQCICEMLTCLSVPPNLSFIIDDAEDPWAFNEKFDFIHGRMMVGSFSDVPRFFQQAYKHDSLLLPTFVTH
jgi:hypothetical protein